MVRKTEAELEHERVAFIKQRVRDIGLTADDEFLGYAFVEMYLGADAAERKRILAAMPPVARSKLRRLAVDVVKRFPRGRA